MKTAAILLKIKDDTPEEKIESIIRDFYARNSELLSGMVFYEFADEKILEEIKALCEKKPEKEECRDCTSCGTPVPASKWYKYAPVILCEECGDGVDMTQHKDELKKAALDHRGSP